QQLVAENSEAITKADLDSIMYQINGEDKLVVLVTPAFVEMTLTQVEGVARINGHELKGEAYERLNRFGDPVDKVFVDWLKDNVLDFDGGGKSPSIFAKDGQILQHLLAVEPIAACYREVDYNLSQYIVSPSTSRAIDELFSKQMKFRECCKAAEVSLDAAIDAFASLGKIQLGLQRSGEMNAAEMRAAISTLLNIVRDAAERPDVSIVDTLEIAIVQDLAKGYVQLLDPKSARLDPTRDVHAFGAVLSAPGQTVV
ncbi:MAG: hypothetical protein KDD60_06005, partial [Bdellovibrionales bacterium]|nr:hypothetical protein [Bdellovibrionales bacterium]